MNGACFKNGFAGMLLTPVVTAFATVLPQNPHETPSRTPRGPAKREGPAPLPRRVSPEKSHGPFSMLVSLQSAFKRHAEPSASPQNQQRSSGDNDKATILLAHARHQRSRSHSHPSKPKPGLLGTPVTPAPSPAPRGQFRGFGMGSRGRRVCLWKVKNPRVGFCCLLWVLFLAMALPAVAQNTVSVRLYSLHPQQQVKITARNGTLRWRTCERCVPNDAQEL